MIITEEREAMMPRPIGDGEATIGPDGEMIEITGEGALEARIDANREAFDANMKKYVYLSRRAQNGELGDDKIEAYVAADELNEMLLRGTFETNSDNMDISNEGTILHRDDYDKFFERRKTLDELLSDEDKTAIAEIELGDGKESVKAIEDFADGVCETVTPENVRAANLHYTDYLVSLRVALIPALQGASLDGVALAKASYYSSEERIRSHFAEMMRQREEMQQKSLGSAAIKTVQKAETE
ncbi:hypothetical protein J6X15_03500 [Candidatus Saccharibacteria bacterium]|nr:hypothetical protein [Candidatus Saccharibacteria bacterium]